MRLQSSRVALAACAEYDPVLLADRFDLVLGAVGALPSLYSCHVLLKPNLIATRYGPLPCTESAFMLAVARWFVDHGARVTIGDSPAFGTAETALRKLGVARGLAALGVRIDNFSEVRNVPLPCGARAGVAAAAMDCDLLVNLPRVKAHAQTRVTLAVKNCFGCLAGLRKPWWHMAYGGAGNGFCDRLVQLLDVLADSLTLTDAVTAMHETGPLHGRPYDLGLIAASQNPVAMDRALLDILGVSPQLSPIMLACRQAGLAGSRLEDIFFSLQKPDQFRAVDFRVPDQLAPIRFDLLRFMRNMVRRAMRRT